MFALKGFIHICFDLQELQMILWNKAESILIVFVNLTKNHSVEFLMFELNGSIERTFRYFQVNGNKYKVLKTMTRTAIRIQTA